MIPPRSSRLSALLALGFVAGFAFLLASFPARNADLWGRLAAGRAIAGGSLAAVSPTWLFDLAAYVAYSLAGGSGVVVAKAAGVAVAAAVLCRASRTSGGWLVPVACAVLAVLATGTRLLVQPATASVLFLALAVWLARRDDRTGAWPGWGLVGLFLVWANTDRWFLAGLGVVGLFWFGRVLDGGAAAGRSLARTVAAVAILAAITFLNPGHLHGYPLPAELVSHTGAAGRELTSPFSGAYLATFKRNPAGLAFFPLFGLGALSFLVTRLRWERLLPWAGMAVLAAVQVRTVPLFAVVAGPVLAWNLQDFFAARPEPAARRRPVLRAAGRGLVAALALVFLGAAWPGWLQSPPYGRRAWTADPPVGVEQGAAALRGLAGVGPAGTRTLHLSAETAAGFAWFCPEEPAVVDDRLVAALTDFSTDPAAVLSAAGVGRVVGSTADRGPRAGLEVLFADPNRWPLLHLADGLAVCGVRRPGGPPAADPYRGRVVDFARRAFRPSAEDTAPAGRPAGGGFPPWWDAFRRPLPPPPADRAQVVALLTEAELYRRAAPVEHALTWHATQAVGLAAALAAGPVGAADTALRYTLFQPPGVDSASAGGVAQLQRGFLFQRDDAPPAVLYLAVRAARRAVAVNPADAAAYLALGEAYMRLLSDTRERVWAGQYPVIGRVRQIQAATALNRAVELTPTSAITHLRLGRLYQGMGVFDLAYDHLRRFQQLAARTGQAEPTTLAQPPTADELNQMGEVIAARRKEFEAEAGRLRVLDRAQAAVRRGLVGRGRDILLASDVAAFGDTGMRLELSLLIRTGRADDVIAWTGPDAAPVLGDEYHRLRGQALAAVGEYAAADAAFVDLGETDQLVDPGTVAVTFARVLAGGMLDGAVGELLPGVIWRAFGMAQIDAGIAGAANPLAERSNVATLRGLVALEAGDVATAEAAFRAALQFSGPDRTGLRFAGQQAAEDALAWLTAAGK